MIRTEPVSITLDANFFPNIVVRNSIIGIFKTVQGHDLMIKTQLNSYRHVGQNVSDIFM